MEPESALAVWAGSFWLIPAVALVLGLLLVSEIPMFGMKVKKGHKLLDAKRILFLTVAVVALVLTFIFKLHLSFTVLTIFTFYIFENLVIWIYSKLSKV